MPPRFAVMMAARFGRERWNEHIRIVVNLLNAVAAACVIGALVAPHVSGAPASPDVAGGLLLSGAVAHVVGHFCLRYIIQKE